jgi:hypothetical protein
VDEKKQVNLSTLVSLPPKGTLDLINFESGNASAIPATWEAEDGELPL